MKSEFLVNTTNRWSYAQQGGISAWPQATIYHDCQKPSSAWLHVQINFWTQARIHCQACISPPQMKVKAANMSSFQAASAQTLFQSHGESCCSGSSSQRHPPTNKLHSQKDYVIPKGTVHSLKRSEPRTAVWFALNIYAAPGERNVAESATEYRDGEDRWLAAALAIPGQVVRSKDNLRRAELVLLAQAGSHHPSITCRGASRQVTNPWVPSLKPGHQQRSRETGSPSPASS